MAIYKTFDSKRNLCDTCSFSQPDCPSGHLEYGNGKGNDNVTACSGFSLHKTENIWSTIKQKMKKLLSFKRTS
jgi:hypothetical protein